jgi:hypothetical protein
LGSTHLNPPAGKGGHLDLLARLDAKMPQQLLPRRDLARWPNAAAGALQLLTMQILHSD